MIIQKSHRNPFDHQLRGTGVKLIEIESREDLQKALGPQTAMMHFTNFANSAGQIRVEEWQKLAAAANIPSFIDAAADTPPVSHLWDYANMGYDLIAFSGGKAMRGPQCAGLLLGKADLVHFALLNNSPYEDVLGRGQKVGKEEIVGMVKALELYLAEDHDALNAEWQRRLDNISAKVTAIKGVSTKMTMPEIANHVPSMQITWDQKLVAITPRDAAQTLRVRQAFDRARAGRRWAGAFDDVVHAPTGRRRHHCRSSGRAFPRSRRVARPAQIKYGSMAARFLAIRAQCGLFSGPHEHLHRR